MFRKKPKVGEVYYQLNGSYGDNYLVVNIEGAVEFNGEQYHCYVVQYNSAGGGGYLYINRRFGILKKDTILKSV